MAATARPLRCWLPCHCWRGRCCICVHEAPIEATPGTQKSPAWDLLRDPGLRRLMLMNWFMNSSWDLHGFMVPLLGHERGLPASVIGSILGAFAIAAAIVRLMIPVFARQMREWVLITGATAVAGLMFLLYPFTRSAVTMGLCSIMIGMALGLVQPMVMSMLHQITPKHRHGEALAVRLILINLSSVGMPMLFGAVGGVLGASGVFWAMGTIVGLGSHLGAGLRGLGEDAADTEAATAPALQSIVRTSRPLAWRVSIRRNASANSPQRQRLHDRGAAVRRAATAPPAPHGRAPRDAAAGRGSRSTAVPAPRCSSPADGPP